MNGLWSGGVTSFNITRRQHIAKSDDTALNLIRVRTRMFVTYMHNRTKFLTFMQFSHATVKFQLVRPGDSWLIDFQSHVVGIRLHSLERFLCLLILP